MYPYTTIDPQAFANEQAMLQQRINQLEQARNQQMSMYAPQSQQQPQAPTSNVNWIQVAGIDGARNQIVQPGHTAWMMDNNSPVFYVKSVDGMGNVTFSIPIRTFPTQLARRRETYWKTGIPISSAYSRCRRHSRIVAVKHRKRSCRADMMRHSWHRICRLRWHSVAVTSKRAFWPTETQPDR